MKTFPRIALFGLACLCPSVLAAAEDRIHAPVDSSRLTRLAGQVHPKATARADRGPVAGTTDLENLALLIKPGPGLEQFIAEQRDPASPNFRRWLTPDQFADRFGLSVRDINEVSAWLRSQGLRVDPAGRGRNWLRFAGTADRVNRVFRTQIRRYEADGELHYANASEPSIPEALAGIVESVEGLHDFAPRPHSIRPQFNSGGSHYLSPEDFATIYNLKPLHDAGMDGTGQSVVVIGQTAIDLADIRAFRSMFGLPASDPQLVLYGTDPGQSANDLVEAALDIEWAGATAPGAKVIYAYARSVTTALLNAIDENLGPIITMSYGGCEQAFAPTWRYAIQQANAQGITVLVSSGDAGAASCDFTAVTPQASKGATVGWPASIPEITAVGGTQFEEGLGNYWAPTNSARLGSALSYIPEAAWNDSPARNDLSSTAGGASVWFSRPSWQFGPGVPEDNSRSVPDISFSSSVQHVSYWVISQNRSVRVGGTSAASPAFAGALAVLNQYLLSNGTISKAGLGNINPMLYRLAQAAPDTFHDVTTGNNKVPCAQSSPRCVNGLVGYDATAGYDMATGLGSADLNRLITRWNTATAPKVALTASTTTPGLDETLQLTATLTAGGGGTPTGTVTFGTNLGGIGTVPVVSAGGVSTATIAARASQIAGGTGLLTATYSGDRVFDSAAASLTVNVKLPTTGSVVVPVISPAPVYQVGSNWPYTIQLVEKNGVATRLTSFTVNGTINPISFFGTGAIPARGTVSAALTATLTTVPLDRTFVFSGEDADGTTWTRQITVSFVAAPGPQLAPAITLTSTPGTVQQNAQASVACQWSHELTVAESSGYFVQLTRLMAGTDNLTGQIPQIFGTTRLAPFGSLRGTVCWDSLTPSRTYQITGTAETNATLTASAATTFGPASNAPASFSTDTEAVVLNAAAAPSSATVRLNFGGRSTAWTVRVLPPNRTAEWLTVTPISGSGAADVRLQASPTGLSPGAYFATLAIQAGDALPQLINVPVTFVVGADSSISIGGVSNAFSGSATFAPGMLTSVYGSGLAAGPQSALRLPLPLTMQNVSATVNGVTAPLYYVGSGQVNLQIPYEAGVGPAVVAINNNGKVAAFPIRISVAAPGLFAPGGVAPVSGKSGDTLVIYISGDGDLTPTLATGATPAAGTAISRLPQSRQPVNVTVAGVPAQLAFAGVPPGVAGVTQINFVVPAGIPAGPQPIVITVGGVASQAASLTVLP